MTKTLEQFGQTIKQKYPQYSDIPDAELGQKMLVKYPQYQDMVQTSGESVSVVQPEVIQPKKGVLEKTTNIVNKVFPGEQVGQAIGTLGGLAFEKTKGLLGKQDNSQFYDISAPSPKQVLGDVANIGLTVAGTKGVGTTGNFTSRLLKTIGLGAGLGGTKAISEGGGIKDVTKSTLVGGAVGAALPIAGAGLRAIGKQIEQLPARFVNSALSRNKSQVLNDIAKDKVDDFAKYVVQNKSALKSANTHFNESSSAVEVLSNKINSALSSAARKSGAKITIGTNSFLDNLAKIPEAQGALLKRDDIKTIVMRLAPQTKQLLSKSSLTLEEANRLRQLVDRTLGDREFLGGQLSSDKIILKQFANNLREVVKNKAPEGTRRLFTELSNEIRFRDGLLERIARKAGNQVLSFGDFIGGGLGGYFGGSIYGAIAGVAARRAIESVPFKITAAKAIDALTKVSPVLEGLAPAQQTAILKLFSEIFSRETEKSP